MILLAGLLADRVVAFVAARLAALGEPFWLLDSRRLRTDLEFAVGIGSDGGRLSYGGRTVAVGDIRSFFLRGTNVPNANGGIARDDLDAALSSFFDSTDRLVIPRPAAAMSNASKPYQLHHIARQGFSVPRTLVTDVPEEARRFLHECGGRVVYKSVSSWRSIVRRLSADDLERLDALAHCPVQFQEYIAGDDVRVHVVGERLYATWIRTDAVDYRYASRDGVTREMRPFRLPQDVAARCLALAKALDLTVAGIDLRSSPEGEWFCFEANVSPDFFFYQQASGQPIGEAVADLLRNGTP